MDETTQQKLNRLGAELSSQKRKPLPITLLDLKRELAKEGLRLKAASNRKCPGMWDLEAERRLYESVVGPLDD